jgi:hypothetical protein
VISPSLFNILRYPRVCVRIRHPSRLLAHTAILLRFPRLVLSIQKLVWLEMKRKMADMDLDTMMEDLSTLCKTPPIPRKHPNRAFYKYRTPLLPTPQERPEMEMVGPPMYRFGSPSELVPKPLFSRSNTLPSQPFQCQSDIVKSPSPLFSRRNTLPPRLSRYATAEKARSPLSSGEGARSTEPIRCDSMEPTPAPTPHEDGPKVSKRKTFPPRPAHATTVEYPASLFCRAHAQPCAPPHFGPAEPTSPSIRPNNSRMDSFPSRVKRVATADNCPPLCRASSVRAPGPTRFVPLDPPSPIILSPTLSNTNSSISSPTPSLCSTDMDSFCSSTPSTPATSPPSSPKFRTPVLNTSYFTPSSWTVAPSPSPFYTPRHLLRRKKTPRKDTLRVLRAKESDACLQQTYDQRTSTYLDGFVFPGIKSVLETPVKEMGRMSFT